MWSDLGQQHVPDTTYDPATQQQVSCTAAAHFPRTQWMHTPAVTGLQSLSQKLAEQPNSPLMRTWWMMPEA
jgi:hypothetical protein